MLEIRRGLGTPYRKAQSLRFLLTRDRAAVLAFLRSRAGLGRRGRLRLVKDYLHVTQHVRGYHSLAEMLIVSEAILRAGPSPTVVECGAAKGSSTAKLSLVTAAMGGRLVVFDSFRGIPDNDEQHRNLDGRPVRFRAGAFTGRLRSVQRTVEAYGAPEVCTFVKGWFDDTLPDFVGYPNVVLLDVDLLSSTRTCLEHLYPRLRPGGVLFTQDGHLEAIVELLGDADFWRSLGVPTPAIAGLGQDKLLRIGAPTGA